MTLLKSILFLIPLVIFILIIPAVFFFRSLISNTHKNKIDNSMIKCDSCETYTHESLVIKKLGKSYCSDRCSST